jgi:hypothetical protein
MSDLHVAIHRHGRWTITLAWIAFGAIVLLLLLA